MKGNTSLKIMLGVLFASLAAAVIIRFTSPGKVEARRTFPVLGTFATVIITAEEELIPGMMESADSLLRHLDTELGRYSTSGELYSLNSTGTAPLDSRLGRLVLLSDSISRGTDFWFDPSLGSLVRVWGFPEADNVPDSAAIAEALQSTGWAEVVQIGTDSVVLNSGAYLDFGAIAKGFAVDLTWEMLQAQGAVECLVEVGGEVRCGSSTGRIWHIGVRHPRQENLAGVLTLVEGAVATSGDYECYFIAEGIRYSHLLSGRTGFPTGNAAGATVTAADCATADAVATAAAVAGPDSAAGFMESLYSSMIIITEDDNQRCTVHEFGDPPWGR